MSRIATRRSAFARACRLYMCAALGAVALAALPVAAETGRLFTPGPNYLTSVQRLTFKLQNLYRAQVALAVAVLASNGTLSFYQKVDVPPNAIVDVLAPVVCTPCTPVVFLADGQLGPSHYKLPLRFNVFLDSTTTSVQVSQIPWELWAVYFAATLTANSIDFGPRSAKDHGCMSWSPGPVRLPVAAGAFIAANYGKLPINVETACIDSAGQAVANCRQTTTIQPLQATLIQMTALAQVLPFILATPGTLALNFAVLQLIGPHQSIYQALMTRAPKYALAANNLSCTWDTAPIEPGSTQ